jgi:hypothetical protein
VENRVLFSSPANQLLKIIGNEYFQSTLAVVSVIFNTKFRDLNPDEIGLIEIETLVQLNKQVPTFNFQLAIERLLLDSWIPTYLEFKEKCTSLQAKLSLIQRAELLVNEILDNTKVPNYENIIKKNNKLKELAQSYERPKQERIKDYYKNSTYELRQIKNPKNTTRNEIINKINCEFLENENKDENLELDSDDMEENYENSHKLTRQNKDLFKTTYYEKKKKYKIKQLPVENSTWNNLIENFHNYETYHTSAVIMENYQHIYNSSIVITKSKIKFKDATCIPLKNGWYLYHGYGKITQEIFNLNSEKFKNVIKRHSLQKLTYITINTKEEWPTLVFDKGKYQLKQIINGKMNFCGFLNLENSTLNWNQK